MEDIKKMDGRSEDILKHNIEKIMELFPEAVTEGKIDFDVLKELMGEEIEEDHEYYRFTWKGKSQARREALKVSTGTLRPCKEESVDFDNTENLFIEGDNLEVLKLLQKSYHNKIKMIYIDPPYNTGNDFVYKDNYKDNLKNYLEQSGQVDEEGIKQSTNTESSGRYHSNWLNMMYPRLILAKKLLREDGVIFISIDDNEVFNLRKICDEIFGETNFVACLPTIMNLKGNNDQFGFAGTHELTTVYIKNKDVMEDLNGIPLEDRDITEYIYEDEMGKFKQGATLMRTGEAGSRIKRPKGYYPIYVSRDLSKMFLNRKNIDDYEVLPVTKSGKKMSWRRSPKKLAETFSEFVIKRSTNGISFYKKQRLGDDLIKGKKPKSLFYKAKYSSGNGTEEIKNLFGERIFDNPKPVSLLKDFIFIGLGENDILLDFFAGSCTSSQAIMGINKDHGGTRKYIMVQLPEKIKEDSEAYKAGYKTIAEIGKDRIRRVINKIEDEDPVTAANMDLGFKVLKLDSSNLREWDTQPKDLEEQLEFMVENIKADRSEDDLLYEIMIKSGLKLSAKVNEKVIGGKKVFEIGAGALIVCLAEEIDMETITGIGKLKEELNPEICRVVFRDNGFKDDQVKSNALQELKRYGIEEVRSI
jgi:adenine-specific DNA-methyltransferase